MVALERPVIDPNVYISAVISPSGVAGAIVDLVGAGSIVPVVSPMLLAELDGVLRRPSFRRCVSLADVEAFVAELTHLGELVEDPDEVPTVSRDSNDDYLVALARAARADVIVSGDLDLSTLSLDGLATLTPRQFLTAWVDEEQARPSNP